MFARLVLLVKSALYGSTPVAPTAECCAAHDEYEDSIACYGAYPSPMEAYRMDVELREGYLALPLLTLVRWRLATAKRPFTNHSRFLWPKRISRFLHPDRLPY